MQHYDVIVIGGGVSGLGVALEASRRHMSTLLLDAGRCAEATSNNTLRIIHGGFRYLQTLHIARMIRSLNDQSEVFSTYRDAVRELPCLMPLRRFGLKSRIPVAMAAAVYGAAMKMCHSPLSSPTILSASEFSNIMPTLSAPHGALQWNDVVMLKPELVVSTLVDMIRSKGAIVQEGAVVAEVRDASRGYTVTLATGEEVGAQRVVNTLGPWLNTIKVPSGMGRIHPEWCLGFNLIVRPQLHESYALGAQSPDGRLFFCVPRGEGTSIGTWYLPVSRDSELFTLGRGQKPVVDERHIEEFIASFNLTLPEFAIRREDIIGMDVGILPMRAVGPHGPRLYGSEVIHVDRGYVEVLSTKYTTFRSQGIRVMRALEQRRMGI